MENKKGINLLTILIIKQLYVCFEKFFIKMEAVAWNVEQKV